MPKTIGGVDFIVDLDGRVIPTQAREIGTIAGIIAARAYDDAFNKQIISMRAAMRKQWEILGRDSGLALGAGLERAMLPSLDRVGKGLQRALGVGGGSGAIDQFRNSLGEIVDDTDYIIAEWYELDDAVSSTGDSARKTGADFVWIRGALEELHTQSNETGDGFDRLNVKIDDSAHTIRDFRTDFRDTLDDLQLRLTSPSAFEDLARRAGGAKPALDSLRLSIADLDKQGHLTNRQMFSLTDQFDSLNKKIMDTDESSKKLGGSWKQLPHGLRQALLIVAAIAGGGADIAVLGSAAGAGLTILAAAAVTAFAALGVLIAGLQGVGDKLSDIKERDDLLNILPKDLTDAQLARLDQLQAKIAGFDPSIASIGRLGAGFTHLQDTIENALLRGAAPAIDSLTNTLLPALELGLGKVAESLNLSLVPLVERLTSDEGISKLGVILGYISDQVPPLISSIGNIAGAFGNILIAANPFVVKFLGWLDRLTARFDEWTGSLEGQSAMREWFANGVKVLSAFGGLLAGVGKTLSNLVDDESVRRTVDFLDNLTGSLPFLEKLIDVLAQLDVFGLVAKILNDVGNALIPVLDLLEPLAVFLNVAIGRASEFIAIIVQMVGIGLTPLKFALDWIVQGYQRLLEWSQPIVDVMGEIFTQIQLAADAIWTALAPAIQEWQDALFDLLPSSEEMARIVREQVIPAINDFADFIIKNVIPAVSDFIGMITDVVESFGGWEGISARVEAVAATLKIFGDAVKIALAPAIKAAQLLYDTLVALKLLPKKLVFTSDLSQFGSGTAPREFATGGIADRPTYGVYGEHGREAFVPLDRPLSEIDPSVRDLAAFARGLPLSGTTNNTRGGAIFQEGAVQLVTPATDGRIMAAQFLDEIAKEI